MSVTNPFSHHTSPLSAIARDVFNVDPSDTTPFSVVPFALTVATGGSLRVTTEKGSIRNLVVVDGETLPVGIRQVWLTGTTASGIKAYTL